MTQLYKRSVRVQVGTLVLTGLRVAFKITKTLRRTPNKAEIKIYNLNEAHRKQIEQIESSFVKIEAGYGSRLATIFQGDYSRGTSQIDGATIITTLEAGDGVRAHRTARVSRSFGANTSVTDVLMHAAESLGVNLGNAPRMFQGAALGNGLRSFQHGTSIEGYAADALETLTQAAGLEWSIQDSTLQVLPRGRAIDNVEMIVLSSEPNTGLVGSPEIDNKGVLKFKSLLISDLVPGRRVQMRARFIRGIYRVSKCEMSGDTRSKDWYCNGEGRAA